MPRPSVGLTCEVVPERATGIEPPFSWEAHLERWVTWSSGEESSQETHRAHPLGSAVAPCLSLLVARNHANLVSGTT